MGKPREMMAAFLLIVVLVVAGAEEDDLFKAAEVVTKLLEENNPAIRPSVNNEPTTVKVQTYVRHVDYDQENDKFAVDLSLRMRWNDYRLVYETPEDVDYITLQNPHLAWIPDPFFTNGIAKQLKSVHPESLLKVYHNGNVTYSTRMAVTLYCPRSFSDSQICDMKIASYGYTTRDIVLEWVDSQPANFASNLRTGDLYLDDSKAQVCHTGDYSCLKLEMILRRGDTCS